MNKLYIVGLGPGAEKFILPAAREKIEKSDVLIGGSRNLALFEYLDKEKIVIGNNLKDIYKFIEDNIARKSITVLASGDPALYGIMDSLNKNLEGIELETIPGISSLQYLCCKLNLSWNDMLITSVHGRSPAQLPALLANSEKTALFTGGGHTPDAVCREMASYGLKDYIVHVGENLSYPDEKVTVGTPETIGGMTFGALTLMLIQKQGKTAEPERRWEYSVPGIPDDMFVRGQVPMTKEEVRAVSLSKLRLSTNSTVFDIGAGTGSVALECALVCSRGMVYAVERNAEGLGLIRENAKNFGVSNIVTVDGEAPEVLTGLPIPDRIFIGGSGGNMDEILAWISANCGKVRVVANTVTVESTYEALEGFKKYGFTNIEIVNAAITRSRSVGGKHLMQAANPVNVISADKGE